MIKNEGFTLLEVIISVGIIAAAVITIYQVIFNYYQTIEFFNEKKNINYISTKYFEFYNTKDSISNVEKNETIEINNINYEVYVVIQDLDVEELLRKNMISPEIIEQYKIYVDRTEDLKEFHLTVTSEKGITYNWTKLLVDL